jgi:hypothetical protein
MGLLNRACCDDAEAAGSPPDPDAVLGPERGGVRALGSLAL